MILGKKLRVPGGLGKLPPPHIVYERALTLCAQMDAERQMILTIAFSHALGIPQDKFEYALRKFKRRVVLQRAARE